MGLRDPRNAIFDNPRVDARIPGAGGGGMSASVRLGPVLLLAMLAATAAGGCGLAAVPPDEPTTSTDLATSDSVVPLDREPENEREALERFARAWIAWTGGRIGSEEIRSLAAGSLRRTLTRQAGAVPRSKQSLEGVLLRPGRPALVITRARTRLSLEDVEAAYAIYLARAERLEGRWRVVQWTPVA